MSDVLDAIAAVVAERRDSDPKSSYVASLNVKGIDKILEKVGEEAVETVLAAKDAEHSGELSDVIYETADLWFHSMVMLQQLGADHRDVINDLARRFGLSGHEEKAQRNKNNT